MSDIPISALGNPELTEFLRWQKEKRAALRKSAKGREKNALRNLLGAARSVVAVWSNGDLAGAVRELDRCVNEYEEVKK